MELLLGILRESYYLLNKMSPYLLFGFLFAGIIHIFIDTETVGRHLGRSSVLSVVKASLFGIPLPLCSCGVLPAAMSLRKQGASRGAILSFLISTPTTGIDSILATFSLMGGFFAAYRVAASFIAGVLSGILANVFLEKEEAPKPVDVTEEKCKLCEEHKGAELTVREKVKGVFTYAFGRLLSDIGIWLVIGIIIGGAISYFMPESFIHDYLGSGWKAMVIMLVIGIPMYVCATGSIPIAAALMLKGMNPGAAFVFLLAGPATNAVGMTVVSKELGKKALGIYIFSIALSSIALGMLLDVMWNAFSISKTFAMVHHRQILPGWLEIASSLMLMGLIVFHIVRRAAISKAREDST